MNQKPPTSAKGSVAMMRAASLKRRNVSNSRTKMMIKVAGTTIFNLSVARSRYSNWPDQEIE